MKNVKNILSFLGLVLSFCNNVAMHQIHNELSLDEQLVYAVQNNTMDRIKQLLNEGANPNSCTLEQTPLLHVAMTKKNRACAKLLIRYGADLNSQDISGKTPLMVACTNKLLSVVKLLRYSGADASIKNYNNHTVIDFYKNEKNFYLFLIKSQNVFNELNSWEKIEFSNIVYERQQRLMRDKYLQ